MPLDPIMAICRGLSSLVARDASKARIHRLVD